ncbi:MULTISPECIES: Bug family tripartite tricarboxylate transporter substrate binding protein [Bradyrhizobium]|jgi:tripartite-type tricarboxylate transporter receptor subunit TctC|uniref:Tripartite-type tricarboxylate transporter, receptor component TctC n=2 Tax=Bradyrhizobium TaxID=374 RepID=A0ABY0Q058_9BRAD|nr:MULTISPECIES: tripartite tricarboxylate transporter substrate binding protein [Bradyrhizobium]SDJ27743.1 Tripartite-type tricarboxylate transporter, receptor component TctC [Bradyrhizobium ottawaense]SEC74023.1 Tripartite-type tricarboxylate transporter, receptor component TctC [Bradyrhizobium lablabi]SHK86968.1 Tripartite-type tricarboxylate transporter, receptor component TctC [Bradyrhizobium lablabi]
MRHAALVSAVVVTLVGLAIGVRNAEAAFPDRTIRIIVPFAPGGPIDAIARPLATTMQEILGATVVIENRSGAGGITGSESVASAAADGYTLLMTTGSHIGNKVFNSAQVRYDPLLGFTPVAGLIESNGIVLLARKEMPADSIATLNAYAKTQPNGLTYGHAGIGNISYIAGELLKVQAGMPLSGIPYRGTAAAMSDLVGGQVDLCFVGISGARSYVDNGQVKVIASTGAERAPVLPGVPTMREAGFPDFVVLGYIGLWAPRDTPKAVVTRLYDAVREALARPNIRQLLSTFGAATEATPPDEFARFLERDFATQQRWARELGVIPK